MYVKPMCSAHEHLSVSWSASETRKCCDKKRAVIQKVFLALVHVNFGLYTLLRKHTHTPALVNTPTAETVLCSMCFPVTRTPEESHLWTGGKRPTASASSCFSKLLPYSLRAPRRSGSHCYMQRSWSCLFV